MDITSIGSPLTGVRHRVLRNALEKIGPPAQRSKADLPPLKPGEMQLYSFFTPGISTGLYDIQVEQNITTSDGQTKTITAPVQSFLVDAPRYSIDPALIHSTFPHQGVAAQANILPHVVISDPHLPWQTEIGKTAVEDTLRIPWLAVIAFEQSELKFQAEDPLFPPGFKGGKQPEQSFTMSSRFTIQELTGSGLNCAVPLLDEQIKDDPTLPDKPIDVIFPEMDLFLALFTTKSGDNNTVDLDRFKYLAHARQVNTTHMTDSAVLESGQFSIVFSHRTGPPFPKGAPIEPKRCVAHLVSLDWIHHIPDSALSTATNKRAALISLFSWTYDCIPPETVNFEDVMRAVGQNSKMYRTPDDITQKISTSLSGTLHDRIAARLQDGYTLMHYRVQTGEETVAFMRGPLTPYKVPEATWMDIHSNTGEDLQIIDTQLGMIDLTYCAAWQLGKSLAIADQAFCAALIRLRASVYNKSSEKAKQDTLSKEFEAATSKRIIGSLAQHFNDMTNLSKEAPNAQRWSRPSLIQSRYQVLAKNKDTEDYISISDDRLRRQVDHLTSATDKSHYTEVKDPMSTDWDLVLNWILNKIYLEKIPPWYLIPDPSWLSAESINFFYFDHKWLSALVDGALSVANHLDAQDKVRQAIKDQLVKYLQEDYHEDLKHPPQVPSYGFFLRSVVVDAFPDLVVRAPWPKLDNGASDLRAEVLRQENIRKDIMLCLLDRTPKDLQTLILSQPPHQQCFMFGHDSTFTTDGFELELRKVYGVHTDKHMDEFPKKSFEKDSNGRCDIYDWNSRTIIVDKFVTLLTSTLQDAHKEDSDIYDKEINASLVGIELNEPIYRLTFTPPQDGGATSQPNNDSLQQAKFSLPASTEPFDTEETAQIAKNYDRPFKGSPRPRKVFAKFERSSDTSLPSLVSAPALLKLAMSQQKLSTTQYSAEAEIPPILSEIDYENMEKCDTRFSANCFALGDPPSTAKDDEAKLLPAPPKGTDVIVTLSRNQTDPNTTDFIHIIEIRIPFGSAESQLFARPLGLDPIQMLNTARFMISSGVHEADVVIHLRPKAVSGLSPLLHNPDMSFMIKGAIVNPSCLDATITIVEWYTSEQGNAKIALNYIHHAQAKPQ